MSEPNQSIYPLVYFAGTRLVFSLFERREFKDIALEILFGLLFVIVSIGLLLHVKPIASAGFVFLVFFATGISPHLIRHKAPVEATYLNLGNHESPVVWIGIIDAAWLSIMGATCALIIIAQQIGVLDSPLPKLGFSTEYYRAAIDEAAIFFGIVITGFFALGGALAGSMAILWAGELWRKQDSKSREQYKAQTIVSIKMTLAFFSVGFAAVKWAAIPLYFRMVELRGLMPPLK